MATRGRGRRTGTVPSAPSEARRSARNTRQTAAHSSAALTPERIVHYEEPVRVPNEARIVSKLATMEPPRRGARPRAPGSAVSSIATFPSRIDSEREDSEEVEGAEGEEEEEQLSRKGSAQRRGSESPGRPSNEIIVSQRDDGVATSDDVRRQIMALSLPDLFKASQELMGLWLSSKKDDPVSQGRLRIKRNAFLGLREVYEDQDDTLFLDVVDTSTKLRPMESPFEPSLVLEHANVASAFDLAEMLLSGREEGEFLPMLEVLDNFPNIFPYGASYFQESENMHLAIRTAFLIESLADTQDTADPYAVVASVFCENHVAQDIPRRLRDGPFRDLADKQGAVLHKICSTRIKEIVSIIDQNKLDFGVDALRARFPVDKLLDDLKQWASTVYHALDSLTRKDGRSHSSGLGPQHGTDYDVEEEIADSVAGSDSQPIIRLPESQQMPSLYRGPESRKFLDDQVRNSSQTPPSNQEQRPPPPGAPKDYPEHTIAQLLSEAPIPPTSSGLLPLEPASSYPNGHSKRKRFQSTADDDGLDDDPFQTDTRPVNPIRKPVPSSSFPDPKRRRLVDSSNGSVISDKASMPPPPIPSRSQAPGPEPSFRSAPPSSASSTVADFDAIKQQKLALTQEARRFHSSDKRSPIKQRQAWLAEDCETLINLIRERQAAWAEIERTDAHRFVHPRNQQAYRDKARNMKVDFLLTDIVLPPGFDLVALGKKEVERVIGLGKNPYRKENDLDTQGNPIRTEYQGSSIPH